MSRVDARLPKSQKEFFERATSLGGFRSLTDFLLSSAQEKAEEIINDREIIALTERDKQIFIEAILNPAEPNEALKAAKREYDDRINRD